jgi:hypothetical protein
LRLKNIFSLFSCKFCSLFKSMWSKCWNFVSLSLSLSLSPLMMEMKVKYHISRTTALFCTKNGENESEYSPTNWSLLNLTKKEFSSQISDIEFEFVWIKQRKCTTENERNVKGTDHNSTLEKWDVKECVFQGHQCQNPHSKWDSMWVSFRLCSKWYIIIYCCMHSWVWLVYQVMTNDRGFELFFSKQNFYIGVQRFFTQRIESITKKFVKRLNK